MNTRQQGFTIVEVVVSIVMMGVILTALGGLTYASARQAIVTSDRMTAQAASLDALNRFTTIPFDDLDDAAGCDTTGTANNQYSVCVTVAKLGMRADVTIVSKALQRDTVSTTTRLVRSGLPGANPLNCGSSC
jgi:prepilin-type N-terminal cleavage/methylation domain-containing protein